MHVGDAQPQVMQPAEDGSPHDFGALSVRAPVIEVGDILIQNS